MHISFGGGKWYHKNTKGEKNQSNIIMGYINIKKVGFVIAALAVVGMAAGVPAVQGATVVPSRLVVVGTVNVQNAMLMSQSNNVFTAGFDLTNQAGAQPDLRYGILLVQGSDFTGTIVDTKVYDDTVSLSANDSKHITLTYTAPSFFAGTYTLAVQVKNSVGFPIGTVPLGKVTLQGSGQYLSIDGGRCYLTVAQDATLKKYTVGEGVDVLPSNDLIAHCTINNLSTQAITAVPHFTTYLRSMFGDVVSSSTAASLSVTAKSVATETFTIPKASDPQAYDAVLTLTDAAGNQISNIVDFHYVIHGASATIQSILFDKDSYGTGDTANVSLTWTGSADSFIGSRLGASNEGALTAEIQIKDGSGAACSAVQTISLAGKSDQATLQVPITASCQNPSANVSLVDASGTVLTNGSYSVQTKPAASHALWWWILGIIIVVAVLVGIYLLIMKRKKKIGASSGGADAMKMVGLVFALALGSMLSFHVAPAHAAQMMLDGNGGDYVPKTKFFECVNNKCSTVYGDDVSSCSPVGSSCGVPPVGGGNPTTTPTSTSGTGNTNNTNTYLACSNNSCVLVKGTNQMNLDGCSSEGQGCTPGSEEGIAAIAFDVNLDRNQYTTGQQVVGTGDFYYTQCDNGSQLGANDFEMDLTVNNVQKALVSYTSNSSWTVGTQSQPTAQGIQYYTAESTPGNYSAPFTLTATWNDIGGGFTKTQNGSISYTVVNPPSNPVGVITVNSYVDGTQTPVTANWTLSGSDLPGGSLNAANLSMESATGTIGGTYTLGSVSANGYTLKDVRTSSLAEAHQSFFSNLLAMFKNLFGGVANAGTLKSCDNGNCQTSSSGSITGQLTNSPLTFEIDWTPVTPPICTDGNTQSCTAANGCSGTETCTSNSWGSCVADNGCTGTLSATLTASPSSGDVPLVTTLTATAVNNVGGTLNYLFWKDCSYGGSSSTQAIAACGQPFKEDDAVAALSDSAATTYSTSGTFAPLAIVESGVGAHAPASARAVTWVTGNNPGCTSGNTQSCTAANGCAGTETCASGSWGSCVADNSCTGGNSLSATLTANPASGTAPLGVTLNATVSGSIESTLNYLFWKDCSYNGSSSTEAIAACGQPFQKDSATTTLSDAAKTTYSTSGTFAPLVIVESGTGAQAPASAEASASIKVNNSGCTPGDTQSCTATTGNYCGMTIPGTETCGANGAWGTCAPPPDSACGYVCVSGACQISSSSGGMSQSDCASACVVPPLAVIIDHFDAAPGLIPPGGLAVLSWRAEHADTCSIKDQGNNSIYAAGNTSSSFTVYPSSTMIYTLTCSNSSGNGSASATSTEQTVTVSPAGIKEGN